MTAKRIAMSSLFLLHLLVLLDLQQPVASYWSGECGGIPDFETPNLPLDCALRELGLQYASKVLAESRHLDMILPRVHRAFNLSMCGIAVPTAQLSARERATPPATTAAAVSAGKSEIFVSPMGSDGSGDGSAAKPFETVSKAQQAARAAAASGVAGVVVWLRHGIHFQRTGPLTLTTADTGCTYAGYPGENATLSGSAAAFPSDLQWKPVDQSTRARLGMRQSGPPIYRAALPAALLATKFVGLTADGVQLPRARYPNCDDITGTDCYLLNASAPTSSPQAPAIALKDIPGGMNLDVVNQNGIDMFADRWDNDQSEGAHGASDSTLPKGTNKTVVVHHPDFAWRCHEDCGWVAYSHWKSNLCTAEGSAPLARSYGDPPQNGCRHDTSFNDNYWQQQVSGGFFYNATAPATHWAPGWTSQTWADPSTGVVHMYQSARWGGWQFQLAARNDTEHSLDFLCTELEQQEDGFYLPVRGKEPAPCSKIPSNSNDVAATKAEATASSPAAQASTRAGVGGGGRGRTGSRGRQLPRPNAIVHGGWQEGRGSAIGPQYTNHKFNNSYFVENIKEELDAAGEWFLDLQEGAIYLIPPVGKSVQSLFLVPVHRPTVVAVRGNATNPVKTVTLANLTIAHAAPTFLEPYEVIRFVPIYIYSLLHLHISLATGPV